MTRLVDGRDQWADGYEGNAQSFRIVAKLATREDHYRGLNLTRGTLNGLMKYPWNRSSDKRYKWGAYSTENEDFEWVRDSSECISDRRTLEAEIMDWADDITYAVHDVQDFYKAGLIPLHSIAYGEHERKRFLEKLKIMWSESAAHEERTKHWDLYEDALIGVVGVLPFEGAYSGDREQQVELVRTGSWFITRYLEKTRLIVDGETNRLELFVEPNIRAEVAVMKALNRCYVIDSPAIKTQQYGARKVITDLFDIFLIRKTSISCPDG